MQQKNENDLHLQALHGNTAEKTSPPIEKEEAGPENLRLVVNNTFYDFEKPQQKRTMRRCKSDSACSSYSGSAVSGNQATPWEMQDYGSEASWMTCRTDSSAMWNSADDDAQSLEAQKHEERSSMESAEAEEQQPVTRKPVSRLDVLDNPEMPNIGSELHAAGTCEPCRWFNQAKCMKGEDCMLCHMPGHTKGLQKRLGKQARDRVKKKAAKIQDQLNSTIGE